MIIILYPEVTLYFKYKIVIILIENIICILLHHRGLRYDIIIILQRFCSVLFLEKTFAHNDGPAGTVRYDFFFTRRR